MADCRRCDALCASRSQIVFPEAAPQGGLLAIGEAPGEEEDAQGVGFVGRAGKTLERLLAEHGIGRGSYGRANVLRCWPQDNRDPKRGELDNCLPFLAEFLIRTKPAVVLAVGGSAAKAFLGRGRLFDLIETSKRGGRCDPALAHPALRPALRACEMRIVAMPHSSPLAFNRNARDGRKWADVGREQVGMAVSLLKGL